MNNLIFDGINKVHFNTIETNTHIANARFCDEMYFSFFRFIPFLKMLNHRKLPAIRGNENGSSRMDDKRCADPPYKSLCLNL